MMTTPDPKPPARIRDPLLLRRLHLRWRRCALADGNCVPGRSLHHVSKHPRDDVEGNLVMLCGDGTRGHHGKVEAWDEPTRAALGAALRKRQDVRQYLEGRYGMEGAFEFLERQYA